MANESASFSVPEAIRGGFCIIAGILMIDFFMQAEKFAKDHSYPVTGTMSTSSSSSNVPVAPIDLTGTMAHIIRTPREAPNGRPVLNRCVAAAPLFRQLAAEECPGTPPETVCAYWYTESRFHCGGTHGKAEYVPPSDAKKPAFGVFQVKEKTAGGHLDGFRGSYDPQDLVSSARMMLRVYCHYKKLCGGDDNGIRCYAQGERHILKPELPTSPEEKAAADGYLSRHKAIAAQCADAIANSATGTLIARR